MWVERETSGLNVPNKANRLHSAADLIPHDLNFRRLDNPHRLFILTSVPRRSHQEVVSGVALADRKS